MRRLNEKEQDILLVAWEFSKVQRYMGIAPERHLLGFDAKTIARLVEEKLLQKVKLKAYSQKIKGYKLTDEGKLLLAELCRPDEVRPLSSLEELLVDVLSVSRLSWNDGVAPKDILVKRHKSRLRLEAYTKGLVAKMTVQAKGGDSVKGYILTNAGYAYLKGNQLI